MPTLSANIEATLGLCGYPSAQVYPNLTGTTARTINQVARMMMREARLSEQNQYLRFLPLNSPTKERAIPSISDVNSICTVELLDDATNDTRIDIPIVDRLDLNARELSRIAACAKFGNPTRIRFTWNPSESADTIYVGYEVLPTDASQMTDIPNLPESSHDCLQYRSAALVMETVLGKECGPVFMDTMGRVEKQWAKWCKRDSEERPTVKPGFGSLDLGDAMEGWY